MVQTLFDFGRPIQALDPNIPADDKPRVSGQSAAILARLQEGPATRFELEAVSGSARVAARVWDLTKAGYLFHRERVSGGVWRYTLIGGPHGS